METCFNTLVMPLLLYLGLLQRVSGSSEDTTPYSCCPSPQIKFNPHCEHLWVINGQSIAWSKGEDKRYMTPCKEIKDGLMELDQCVNLNVTILCNNLGVAAEQRISYHGELCPTPTSGSMAPGTQGYVTLLLAALILVLIR